MTLSSALLAAVTIMQWFAAQPSARPAGDELAIELTVCPSLGCDPPPCGYEYCFDRTDRDECYRDRFRVWIDFAEYRR